MPARLKLWGTNVLIAVVLLLVAIEALPQSPPALRGLVKPVTRSVGLVQSWGLFVPPDIVNTRLRAEITYADGQRATWNSPDWPKLTAGERLLMHRQSEWLDNIWGAGDSPAITSWARHLARSQRPDHPQADRGAEVKIIMDQAAIPAADVRPWASWKTRLPTSESTTLAIEKLP